MVEIASFAFNLQCLTGIPFQYKDGVVQALAPASDAEFAMLNRLCESHPLAMKGKAAVRAGGEVDSFYFTDIHVSNPGYFEHVSTEIAELAAGEPARRARLQEALPFIENATGNKVELIEGKMLIIADPIVEHGPKDGRAEMEKINLLREATASKTSAKKIIESGFTTLGRGGQNSFIAIFDADVELLKARYSQHENAQPTVNLSGFRVPEPGLRIGPSVSTNGRA